MKRLIKKSEALAIMAEAVHSDGKAQWWDSGIIVPPNERCGSVEVVHVRGSLNHHPEPGCDSYEEIVARAQCAFEGEEEGKPDAVVLRIDSPGGLVSGLNETVFALRRMSEKYGIPLYAYVDELAASAAYALSCACSEIVLPPSAIAGSIGVISMIYDQTISDEQMGLKFVTITSGARKADGHPHVPISDAAINAEQRRVDRLAKQFFRLVADARPLSVKDIESFQAGIFLGAEAVSKGLADAMLGWEEFIDAVNNFGSVKEKVLDTVSQDESAVVAQLGTPARRGSKPMSLVALTALRRKTEAAIASEKDPEKKKLLSASLASTNAAVEAYKKTKHMIEKTETEEGEDEAASEGSEESEGAEGAKGNETDRKEDAEKADGDSDEDEDEGDEKKSSATKALLSLAQEVTGKSGRAAIGALAAKIAQGERANQIVEQIQKERRAEKKTAAIDAALSARRIAKHEAKTLRDKPLSFVQSYLEMRPKAIINVDEDSVHIPNPNAKAGDGSGLSGEILGAVDMAVSSAPDGVDKVKLRQSMIEAHEQRMASGLNGAGGRY